MPHMLFGTRAWVARHGGPGHTLSSTLIVPYGAMVRRDRCHSSPSLPVCFLYSMAPNSEIQEARTKSTWRRNHNTSPQTHSATIQSPKHASKKQLVLASFLEKGTYPRWKLPTLLVSDLRLFLAKKSRTRNAGVSSTNVAGETKKGEKIKVQTKCLGCVKIHMI